MLAFLTPAAAMFLGVGLLVEGMARAWRRRDALEAGWIGAYLGSFALHVCRPFSMPRVLSTICPLTQRLAALLARRRVVAALAVIGFAVVAFSSRRRTRVSRRKRRKRAGADHRAIAGP